MNLLEQYVPPICTLSNCNNPDIITFEEFRSSQYDKLEYFVNLCVDYISKIGGGYIKRVETNITPELKYEDVSGYALTRVQIKIQEGNNVGSKKQFFSFSVPTLIENNFFYLNGSYYSPTCYILDKPISVKKKSIKLAGLFNSITVFTKDKRVIFCGHNIPINYFLQLFITDQDEIKEFLTHFKIPYIVYSISDLETYFSGILNCEANITKIKDHIETLFFDDYTKDLYKNCYDFDEISIKKVLSYGMSMSKNEDKISFVDLTQKRLVFMELILRPIFQKCADFALRANRGYKANEMGFGSDEVIKYFNTKLKSNFLYDVGNLFSAISTHKVSMMNPGSDNAPSDIASVHPSHIGRLCSVAISNQRPGEVSNLIPGLKINKLGLFVNE